MKFSERFRPLWACQHCGATLLPRLPCVFCGGNAARAGRMVLQLGVRVRYLEAAERVGRDRLSMAASMRLHAAIEDRTVPGRRAAAEHAWEDVGYCLDAPEELPAGSCLDYDLSVFGEDAGIPVQRTVRREAFDDVQ